MRCEGEFCAICLLTRCAPNRCSFSVLQYVQGTDPIPMLGIRNREFRVSLLHCLSFQGNVELMDVERILRLTKMQPMGAAKA